MKVKAGTGFSWTAGGEMYVFVNGDSLEPDLDLE